MDAALLDYVDARNRMVDSQIRPNKVTDPRVLDAMRAIPRERFLPAALRARAYVDEDVPLGGGRVLMEPMVLARMIQLAAPLAGERALVVGAGTGYGAAILAFCGVSVVALEEDKALLAMARELLADQAPGVVLSEGPLAAGWPAGAPYDLILLQGAVQEIPAVLGGQLRHEAGRLVTVLSRRGRVGEAVIAEATQAGLGLQAAFDCATPEIPSLRPAPAFVF